MQINIEKKHLYVLIAIMVFLIGSGCVIAWDSRNPKVHGHTANEIEGAIAGSSGGGWTHSGAKVWDASPIPTSWTDLDLSSIVGNKQTLVLLKARTVEYAGGDLYVRTKGDAYGIFPSTGVSYATFMDTTAQLLIAETDSNGMLQIKTGSTPPTYDIFLLGYVGGSSGSGSSEGLENIMKSAEGVSTVTANCASGKKVIYAIAFTNDYEADCSIPQRSPCGGITFPDCIGDSSCTYTGNKDICSRPGKTCLQVLCAD